MNEGVETGVGEKHTQRKEAGGTGLAIQSAQTVGDGGVGGSPTSIRPLEAPPVRHAGVILLCLQRGRWPCWRTPTLPSRTQVLIHVHTQTHRYANAYTHRHNHTHTHTRKQIPVHIAHAQETLIQRAREKRRMTCYELKARSPHYGEPSSLSKQVLPTSVKQDGRIDME